MTADIDAVVQGDRTDVPSLLPDHDAFAVVRIRCAEIARPRGI